jgi:Rhodopirellula transposase DDE domain
MAVVIDQRAQAGGRIRRARPWRPELKSTQAGLKTALEGLIDPLTRGDLASPLRWTCHSLAKLAAALKKQGWSVSSTTVRQLLQELGYGPQLLLENPEDGSHPDWNGQFEYINAKAANFLDSQQPVISVGTTKAKLVGNFDNDGSEWEEGAQDEPFVHAVTPDASSRPTPRGGFDMPRDEALVHLDQGDHTSACGVASIRRWWRMMGKPAYPDAKRIFVTADAIGTNGYRSQAWKLELQRMADTSGLSIHVSHFPPGLSKWNTIGNYLICYFTQTWRGRRYRRLTTVVELSGHVRIAAGMHVQAAPDGRRLSASVVVTNTQTPELDLHPSKFRGEWNYELRPRKLAK